MNISITPEYRINFSMTVVACQQSHEQIRMLGPGVVLIPASAVGRLIEKGSERESRTVPPVVEQQKQPAEGSHTT